MGKKYQNSKDSRHLYSKEYFLSHATGHTEYEEFDGSLEKLIDKFRFIISAIELHQGDELLDIGCGRGEIVIYHAANGGSSTGVDFSEDALKIAQEKAAKLGVACKFIAMSFEDIPDSPKYDKIVALDFIEHISREEGSSFFKKCYSLLKPGGKLLVYTFPNTLRRKYGYKLLRAFSILKGRPLPKKETDTISEHYKKYHLNEQNLFTLKSLAILGGFSKININYYDPSLLDSGIKTLLAKTPVKHLFLKGLTLTAGKQL